MRILSLNGGGIRGALTACFLVEMERQLGRPAGRVFDMVAGTSTGALIAAAIAAGLPAAQILDIYQKHTPSIFNHSAATAKALLVERGWSYDSNNIRSVLAKEFGSKAGWTLNDCPIRVLITAMGASGHAWYFVKDNPKNSRKTGGLSLLDCATASAAAPTYFSPHYVNPNAVDGRISGLIGWCFDGGIAVMGCPVYQACVEAFEYDTFSPSPADTQVVSLGTGYYHSDSSNPPAGLLATIGFTVDSLIDSSESEQVAAAQRQWPGIVKHFDWPLASAVDMADVAAIPDLVRMGKKLASEFDWATIIESLPLPNTSDSR